MGFVSELCRMKNLLKERKKTTNELNIFNAAPKIKR